MAKRAPDETDADRRIGDLEAAIQDALEVLDDNPSEARQILEDALGDEEPEEDEDLDDDEDDDDDDEEDDDEG